MAGHTANSEALPSDLTANATHLGRSRLRSVRLLGRRRERGADRRRPRRRRRRSVRASDVTFDANGTFDDLQPASELTYAWTFGDGTSASGAEGHARVRDEGRLHGHPEGDRPQGGERRGRSPRHRARSRPHGHERGLDGPYGLRLAGSRDGDRPKRRAGQLAGDEDRGSCSTGSRSSGSSTRRRSRRGSPRRCRRCGTSRASPASTRSGPLSTRRL